MKRYRSLNSELKKNLIKFGVIPPRIVLALCQCFGYDLKRLYAVDRVTSNNSIVIPAATGVISSRVWRDSFSAHTPQRPRLICVQPHQRINFTLVDFSVDDPPATLAHMQVGRQPGAGACPDPLVIVSEGDQVDIENGTLICGGENRLSSVYLSESNCVRLVLNATATRTAEFLIRYEGICNFFNSTNYCNPGLIN